MKDLNRISGRNIVVDSATVKAMMCKAPSKESVLMKSAKFSVRIETLANILVRNKSRAFIYLSFSSSVTPTKYEANAMKEYHIIKMCTSERFILVRTLLKHHFIFKIVVPTETMFTMLKRQTEGSNIQILRFEYNTELTSFDY